MGMNIGEVIWMRKVSVKEFREQKELDLGREKGRNDMQTYL